MIDGLRSGILTRLTVAAAMAGAAVGPVSAQIRTIDPNTAGAQAAALQPGAPVRATTDAIEAAPAPALDTDRVRATEPARVAPAATSGPAISASAAPASTLVDPTSGIATPDPNAAVYQDSDVFEAAEGAFGKGAEGLAKLLQRALKEQGKPNAYIVGREGGGAFVAGVRYGSGTMYHKVEGQLPVFWTGPSVGFDVGANGGKVFVLVYNLFDSEELYRRFPAAEGNLYAVGGFTASYLRRGDIVLIPIRLGVGWRAGVNVGYMRFSKTSKWLPF